MAAKNSTLNSSQFARTFLRSLSKVKPRTPVSPPSTDEIAKRTRRIKMAADYAMARTVGPAKAWSRAVLFNLIHKRARNRRWRRAKKMRTQKKKRSGEEEEQVEKLRRVVPGGKSMEVCVLMEETAHYMDCLSTQVKLLQAIADLCYTSTMENTA